MLGKHVKKDSIINTRKLQVGDFFSPFDLVTFYQMKEWWPQRESWVEFSLILLVADLFGTRREAPIIVDTD